MPTNTSQLSIDLPLDGNGLLTPLSCSINYYDGQAFEGLPLGQMGDHGAVVKTESLVIRDEQIDDIYSTRPQCFESTPDWNSYPSLFKSNFQNSDQHLGFELVDDDDHTTGWYRVDIKNKYDFQDTSASLSVPKRGLVVMSKDCFDNLSEIIYDDYAFLPIEARQYYNNSSPAYLSTSALYDYRLFKPIQVMDENLNRSRFDYSPLGLLKGVALIGQSTKTEGDIVTNDPLVYVPSTTFEYDLMEFYDSHKPVWVKTIQREEHWQEDPSYDAPTIQKIEFSDGFGRVLQARAQAEDSIFGPTSGVGALTGDSGLPVDQASNANAVGHTKATSAPDNVVVSGWKVYNNKGKVVEEYEPFFSSGYVYQSAESTSYLLQKMTIRYDAGGRPTETTFPDGSKSLIVYGIPNSIGSPPLHNTVSSSSSQSAVENSSAFTPSPWERFAYDQNDLAPLTTSGSGNFAGAFTPKSELVDALGRTIKTTEHDSQSTSNVAVFEDVVMEYQYDIQGNLVKVIDPVHGVSNPTFIYKYNLQKQPLYTKHIDSGVSRVIPDALGKPIQADDAKGAQTLSRYDRLQRPVMGWSKDGAGISIRLTTVMTYGDDEVNALLYNLKGKLFEALDEAGLAQTSRYDFKGNLLRKSRWVISATDIQNDLDNYTSYRINWDGGSAGKLDTIEFQTDNQYDALNRITQLTLPEDVDTNRKTIVPKYNRAGALEKVSYDTIEYVSDIAYNAKGQRLLIAFGNDVMTRYAYDPITFRLLRQRSEKFTLTTSSTSKTYAYNAGTNRQDEGFNYDLVGNILKILERKTDCGITGSTLGSDALDRDFTYDPLYRLKSATGRESDTQNQNDYLYADAPPPGSPNADNVRAYTRKYSYDKIGNVLQMKQLGSNGFTRDFVYNTNVNTLKQINTGSAVKIQDFKYDAVGNQITAGDNRYYEWTAGNGLFTYKNQVGASDPTIFAQYQYDASGNRVSKMVRTGTDVAPVYEWSIYIDGVFEYHKLDDGTVYEKNYVHIMDDKSRICMVRIGTPFPDDITENTTYVLENQIGSSAARLDNTGGVIDIEEYYPFGDSSLRTFTKKRYRYVGKEKDLESGLYYYGARYYAAWTCRFISVDPLASDYPFYNPYNYAGNKPIDRIDIDGLQEEPRSGGGGQADYEAAKGSAIESGTGYSGKTKQNEDGSTTATLIINGVSTEYTWGGDESNNTSGDPIQLDEVVVTAKASFWQKAGDWMMDNVVDNIPVVGGLVSAYKSFKDGDIKGALISLGEVALDIALFALTGGIGNIVKAGLKAGVKIGAKYIAKETAENYAQGKVNEQTEGMGMPLWAEIAVGVTLGIKAKNARGAKKSVLTNKQAAKQAKMLGFGDKLPKSKIPKSIQKQTGKNPVYYDKKTNSYYSPDKAGHRADNAWKKFDPTGNRQTGTFVNGEFSQVSK
jgi:RHS repeat-associated protein